MRAKRAVWIQWVTALLSILIAGCSARSTGGTLDDLLSMEDRRGYEGRDVSDARIEELTEAIRKYRSVVEEKVRAADQMGVYYKMLGQAYFDRGMYGLAIQAFSDATEVHPENAVLYYKAALSAARYGKTRADDQQRRRLLEQSESFYSRGLSIDPGNMDMLYGLAILYVFELDRPADALPPLSRLLEREPNNVSALFLSGRALTQVGRRLDALGMYERAAEATGSAEIRKRALDNVAELMGVGVGND